MPVATGFSNIPEMLDRMTKKYVGEHRPMLMRKVNRKFRLFSLGPASLGVEQKDRIAVISENRPERIVADTGIATIGAVDVSVYPTLAPQQIAYVLTRSETKIVVSNALQLKKGDENPL